MLWVIPAIVLTGAGGFAYYKSTHSSSQTAEGSGIQTAVARRGDLIISASGSGILTASDEANLSFTASGQVTGVFVKPGDKVKAGDLLAQESSSEAQVNYEQASFAYQKLTSSTAIAAAQESIAQAQADLNSARLQLEYLISPDVLYWETEIDKGQVDLEQARTHLKASPSDTEARQAVTKAEAFLDFAQGKLKDAWDKYYKEYVPDTFPIAVDADKDIYAIPSDLEVSTARAAISEAQTHLKESQELYNVLTGGTLPEDPSSEALIALRQAKLDFEDAQAALDGTKIIAPIPGTIMEVDTSVGATADTSTVIVLADLSQLSVQTYLDESDYSLFKVGSAANVVFDALPDQTFTGKVTSVDLSLDSTSGSSVASGLVELAPTQANLVIGMSASVEVIGDKTRNAVLVPVNALHQDSSGQYSVFVMDNGTPVQREVEVGLQDLVNAEIKSGLNPGEVVLTGALNTN